MDRSTVLWLLALNVLAGGVLYSRFSGSDLGSRFNLSVQTLLSNVFPSTRPTCGLLHWDSYVLVSDRVVLPDGVRPAAVYIGSGRIHHIMEDTSVSGPKVLRFKSAVISPGVIDVHVHLNEPGREEWEGIETGTRAAVVGGVTTVVDMPLNSFPVTTTVEQLRAKQELAKVKANANIAYWAGLVPANAANHTVLQALLDGRARGFKAFMSPSGINDFANVDAPDIAAALPFLKQAGVPLFVHAERVEAGPDTNEGDPRLYQTYLDSRPPAMEQAAIQMLIKLLDEDKASAAPGFVVHIAHLSDAGCLGLIQDAQARHPISVETVPHYLHFNSEAIAAGQTQFKCAPPIRDAHNKVALRRALASGAINLVSSDHSPAPPAMKHTESGLFTEAWGGIAGLQYLVPATWTALSQTGAGLERLTAVLSEEPAKLAGFAGRKGQLAPGFDADIMVWEPESPADTSIAANQHKHKLTPYTDLPLLGKVVGTIVQGHFVFMSGAMSPTACGEPL
ncbi:allantoinase [Haematococcus lacustris]